MQGLPLRHVAKRKDRKLIFCNLYADVWVFIKEAPSQWPIVKHVGCRSYRLLTLSAIGSTASATFH